MQCTTITLPNGNQIADMVLCCDNPDCEYHQPPTKAAQ